MPTANFYVGPEDGWVQVADSPAYVRVSGYPHSHPYYAYAGSSAPSLVAIAATGTVTFSTAVPTAGHVVTIGSETYTARASATLPFEFTIGATFADSATNFTTAVNTYSTLVNASDTTSVVTLTAKAVGTQGNYSITTNDSNIAVSGAAMTGGIDVTVGVLLCHHPLKINVTMTEKLYARVQNSVPNSNRRDGKLRVDVLTI